MRNASLKSTPFVIAGPCVAESFELLERCAIHLMTVREKLVAQQKPFDFIFKASFDKANRSSIHGYRGPGIATTMAWFAQLKKKHSGLKILTDVHETAQVAAVAEVCDILQIPAFLCRQTDLIVEAAKTGRPINVKKGQFMAPEASKEIVKKVAETIGSDRDVASALMLTERGVSFGYGQLVVDMKSFPVMSSFGVPVVFDITHSLQNPPSSKAGTSSSGGERQYAPVLARAAVATGYVDGLFLEVHPDPENAKSDKHTQLSFLQAEELLQSIIPLWYHTRATLDDRTFNKGLL